MSTRDTGAVGSRFENTAFAREILRHVRDWRKRHDDPGESFFSKWEDGVHPRFREQAVAAVIADDVRLHDFAHAVTSSQVFALNLFLPFRAGPRDALAAALAPHLGTVLEIERIAFEWIPPGSLLGEIDGDRPAPGERATGVDVVLWCRLPNGAPAAVLLEVKLTEGGFTTCGGVESRGNRRRDVCASAEKFFADPAACYLQRPFRKTRDRRYWTIFTASHGSVRAAFPNAPATGACPFAGHAQQPMRNLAIARGLEQEGTLAKAWYGLCAHDANPDVATHWDSWRSLLPDPAMAPILPASTLLTAGRASGLAEWADWMADRYHLVG